MYRLEDLCSPFFRSPLFQTHSPALRAAARYASPPQVRWARASRYTVPGLPWHQCTAPQTHTHTHIKVSLTPHFPQKNCREHYQPVLRSRSRLEQPLLGRLLSQSRFFCWSEPGAGAPFFMAAPAASFRQAKNISLILVSNITLRAV